MLLSLYPRLQKRNNRFIYDWSNLISDSSMILKYNTKRYEDMPFLLNEVTKRLKAMVLYIDMNYISRLTSDLDIYLSYIDPFRFKIEAFIRSVFPTQTRGAWVNNNTSCEIVIPIQSVDPIGRLPFEKDYSFWKEIKPVSVHYHDSPELSYNINNALKFNIFQPSVFVFTVDIVKFILKYIKYTKTIPAGMQIDEQIDKFVYHELYIPLIEDMYNVWVLNLVDSMLDATSPNDVKLMTSIQSGRLVPPAVAQGLHGLYQDVDELSKGNIPFEDFINTQYFNGRSLIDLMQYNINDVRTYGMLQYKHHEFLLELPLIKLLYKINKKNSVLSSRRNIEVVYERSIANFLSNRVYNQFGHPILRSYVESSLYSMKY